MSSNNYQSIAFFDVDHTLIDGNSGFFTSLRLVQAGILKKRRVFQALYYKTAYNFWPQDIEKIYRVAIADMEGMPLEEALSIGQECFEKDLKKRFFPQALKILKKHQSQKHLTVLLTNGPYMTIWPLQKYLGCEEARAIGPVLKDGKLTKELQKPLCLKEGKTYYAKEIAKQQGIRLRDCYFYTDHSSDLDLLEHVGFPQTVNPEIYLKKIAKERNWPIHQFKRS